MTDLPMLILLQSTFHSFLERDGTRTRTFSLDEESRINFLLSAFDWSSEVAVLLSIESRRRRRGLGHLTLRLLRLTRERGQEGSMGRLASLLLFGILQWPYRR